ncbi:CHASE3 domain-containing protein [Desertivirga xinjiangensis]|uniref:CHASE3 domain-containing protein n=1 Tax=Desertivirga xinjiangensis TaxID=539206 RepID=UPI00210C14B6|nr:CHASE3 domain-containing protein [Pedobacter xinjiangensis]
MPKLSFQQRVLTGFITTLILVFTGAIISYNRIRDLQKDSLSVDRTQEIIKFTNQVFINIVQAESSVRGLIATGNSYYLDDYNESLSKINPSVDRLSSLLKEDPSQRILADSLRYQVSQKLYAMSKILWAFNLKDFQKAQSDLLADRTINKVQSIVDAINTKENALLTERRKISEANVEKSILLFFVGSAVIMILFLVLFQFIRLSFKKRKIVEDSLAESNFQLKKISEENELQNWILKGNALMDEAMRGQRNLKTLSNAIIRSIGEYSGARIGALYLFNENKNLQVAGTYAFDSNFASREIKLGEGLVGQVAKNKDAHILKDIPADYIKIKTALGGCSPKVLILQPVFFEDEIIGVVELGYIEMPEIATTFIRRVVNNIGIVINSVQTMNRASRTHAVLY